MNTTANDLSLKLVYVAILAGLVLAFTGPLHFAAIVHHRAASATVATR